MNILDKIIIDKSITPEFKAGNYYQGLDNGVESIDKTLKGEFNPDKVVKKKKKGSCGNDPNLEGTGGGRETVLHPLNKGHPKHMLDISVFFFFNL